MHFLHASKKNVVNIVVAILFLAIFSLDLFSFFELKFQDAVYQRPNSIEKSDIYVFGIDEKSLEKFGRFQDWDRQIMADAINILNRDEENKPAVIAVDILYTENSNNEVADLNLAEAAKNGGNVVVASTISFARDLSLTTYVYEHIMPYAALAQYVDYGVVNAILDSDGVVRYATLKLPYKDDFVYGFSYAVYKKYMAGQTIDFAENEFEGYITYYERPNGFYGVMDAGTSFADIFAEDFEPEFFADSIVFIGPYAPGFMDSYYTPVSQVQQMYGVEIHANVTQMLLNENFKIVIPFEINWVIMLIIIVLMVWTSEKLDIRILFAVIVVFCISYIFLAIWLFDIGYVSMLLYPLFTISGTYIYKLIYRYVLERLEKQKVKDIFKKYIDPNLVDELIKSEEIHANKVGVRKNIAVLFVDIRGFTPMTEALKDQPEVVVKILNQYLELTTNAIFNNGGSVDKFIGDATMALFNGFTPLDDYVFKAVKAGLDMAKGAKELNNYVKEQYGVSIGFGVGINCGDTIIGNLGSTFRKDYTAIGDTVNVAARLESNAKRSQILVSEYVYDVIKDRVDAESIGKIPLKGKDIEIEIFSVKGLLDTE